VLLHPFRALDHIIRDYRDHLATDFRASDPDPYWVVPPNENVHQPVIDQPIPSATTGNGTLALSGDAFPAPSRKGRRSRKS